MNRKIVSPRRGRADRGVAAAFVALLIVPMLAFAAVGVDVAGWYVFGQRLQRASDAGATAGVAHLPDLTAATTEALIAVERNGVDVDDPDVDVYVEQEDELELRVTIIDRGVDQFFSAMFRDNVTIARTAVARYVPTIPFGSDTNTYGDVLPNGCEDINAACAGTGVKVGWWASINGPLTGHSSGDPYATQCLTGEGGSCDYTNPQYRSEGYLMAIDVPTAAVGSTITVELFDPAYIYRSALTGSAAGVGDGGATSSATAPHTRFTVFQADASPVGYSTTTEVSGCAATYLDAYDPTNGATIDTTYRARWTTLCTFIPSTADVYPLRIQTSGFTGANNSATGWNNFSIRVTSSSGTNPHVFGISDMSIHANQQNTSSFNLAEVLPDYAGKVMSLLLFDSGDGSGSTTFTLTPTSPSGPLSSCQYRSWSVGGAFSAWATATPCAIITRQSGTSLYNDKWLEIRIPIATTYTCTDCWWSIEYDTGGGTFFERTVWSINIDSDPLRLIE